MEEHCYGSWIQRTMNVLVSLIWSPSGRQELVKNQPCLSAKVFLSCCFFATPFFGFSRGRITHGLCLRALCLCF